MPRLSTTSAKRAASGVGVARGRGNLAAGATPQRTRKPDAIDRLGAKIVVDGELGCWLYRGVADKYHQIKGAPAHRWMWEFWWKKEVPQGWHVHHVCERPGCINPGHLHPVPPGTHRRIHTKTWTPDEIRQAAITLYG